MLTLVSNKELKGYLLLGTPPFFTQKIIEKSLFTGNFSIIFTKKNFQKIFWRYVKQL